MKFFFSGSEAIQDPAIRDDVITACTWRLQSCHGRYLANMYSWLDRAIELGISKEIDIMLDSGAFTAWSVGEIMTYEELILVYSEVARKYEGKFKSIVYINLDVIPGTRKREATKSEIASAPVESDKNYWRLREQLGDVVLPVMHQNEPWERLTEITSDTKYICVSPNQTLSEKERVTWVRSVRERLKDSGVKTHGLATTGNTIIRACDWYSVDSSTWVVNGGFGNMMALGDDNRLWIVPVSNESPGRHSPNAHFDTVSDMDKQILSHAADRTGYSVDLMRHSHEARRAHNLKILKEWSYTIKPEPVTKQEGLFDV